MKTAARVAALSNRLSGVKGLPCHTCEFNVSRASKYPHWFGSPLSQKFSRASVQPGRIHPLSSLRREDKEAPFD